MLKQILLSLLALSLWAGCQAAPRAEQADRGEQAEEAAFLNDHLPKQSVVTVAEAYRAMVLLADGKDSYQTFSEREQALLQRGIAREAWHLERDAPVDKGSVAYMVYKIAKLPGGINNHLFGTIGVGDRRYALRELAYRQLMPNASPWHYMTGGELVDVTAKADRYMAERGAYSQENVDLGQVLSSQPAPGL